MNSPSIDPACTRMFREASEAPAAVARQLAANRDAVARLASELRSAPPRAIVTCARGSSDHAATVAKYLFETRLGILTASAAPSVSSVYGAQPGLRDCLFVAISQSGASPDLVAAARGARDAGARVVALVNDAASPLAASAHHALALWAGEEKSVAATKSYIASLAAIAHLVAAWSGDRELSAALEAAPRDLERAWQLDWSRLVQRLAAAADLYVIARGVGLGVAQEAALKCKETCGLHAESFSAAEVRHGPQALLQPAFPALVFAQADETRSGVEALAAELAARGIDVFLAGGAAPGATALPSIDAHPAIAPMLTAQAFYRAANALAIARGHNPDEPPHLTKVTRTT
jgi:glucosamine--fructose-6-phosphate aminotransferase (isomerizing)